MRMLASVAFLWSPPSGVILSPSRWIAARGLGTCNVCFAEENKVRTLYLRTFTLPAPELDHGKLNAVDDDWQTDGESMSYAKLLPKSPLVMLWS